MKSRKRNFSIATSIVMILLVLTPGFAVAASQPGHTMVQPTDLKDTQKICLSPLNLPVYNDPTVTTKKHILATVFAPLAPNVVAITFTLQNSKPAVRKYIGLLINNSLLHLINPSVLLFVRNVNFTVEFTIKNQQRVNRSRFMFFSATLDRTGNNTGMIWTENHQFTVTGFTGFFKFFRGQLLRLTPAHMELYGLCEQATMIRTT